MIFTACTLDSRGSCTIITLKISKLVFKFTKAKQNETRACKVKIKILSKKHIIHTQQSILCFEYVSTTPIR